MPSHTNLLLDRKQGEWENSKSKYTKNMGTELFQGRKQGGKQPQFLKLFRSCELRI